jgi:hypothetical protein
LDGGLNTYLYANSNPTRFTDQFGLATEATLGVCVAGGLANPLCDAAIVINACKWIVIGGISIMLSGDNPQCNAANDDNFEECPNDKCKKRQELLNGTRANLFFLYKSSTDSQDVLAAQKAFNKFNKKVSDHNKKCTKNKVRFLPPIFL